MCGRYSLTQTQPKTLQAAFGLGDDVTAVPSDLPPRYNIAPTQLVAVVVDEGKGQGRQLDAFRWGLIPSWAKDMRIGAKMINARAETVAEKPSFRAAFKRRRCLVLADGFYEWRNTEGGKIPTYIYLRHQRPFAFAGLWETWYDPAGNFVPSCTIITTTPNKLMAPIHNRMPVILPPEQYETWLNPQAQNRAELEALLQPYPAEAMTYHPVSTTVNSPANDGPACVEKFT